MIDPEIPILLGLGIIFGGFLITTTKGFDNKSYIILGACVSTIGLIFVGLYGISEMQSVEKNEAIIAKQVESMSCTQLHDALLHNAINGTSHIQRATERYVAGCETK